MCTLILAHRFYPQAPLVVAANRDEFLSRPAIGPRVYPGSPRVLMPRDEQGGGTWLGLNQHGLFVGITNRAGRPPDLSRRSRGQLVVHALQAHGALALHRTLGRLDPRDYNAFHLMYADGHTAHVTWSDGEVLRQYDVPPGVHIVTERSLGADDQGRTELLERRFREISHLAPTVERLKALLTIHGPADNPVAGSCVHLDALGYGTRSSFLHVAGQATAWVEGKPCTQPATDIHALVGELTLRNA